MRPWGVAVSLLQIGFVHSRGFTRVLPSQSPGAGEDGPYAAYYRSMTPFIARLMERAKASPESIAARIVALLRRRRPPLRAGLTRDARLFYLLRRLLPRALYHEVLYRELPGVEGWVKDKPAVAGEAVNGKGAAGTRPATPELERDDA